MASYKAGGVEFDIVVNASSPAEAATKTAKASKEIEDALVDVDATAKNTSDQFSKLGKSIGELQALFGKVNSTLSETIAKQIKFSGAITDSATILHNSVFEIKAATEALKKFSNESEGVAPIVDGVNDTTSKLPKTTKAAANGMAAFGRSSGAASIQVQQLIGQIQGGQSPLLALSQQSADLGIVLGAPLLGAVAGISASLAGMLLPSLFDSGNAAEELKEKLEALAKTELLTANQAAFLSQEEAKSVKEKEKTIKKLQEQIAEDEKLIARERALEESFKGNAIAQARASDAMTILGSKAADAKESLLEKKATVALLSGEVEKAKSKIEAYGLMSEEGAKLTDEQKESIENLISSVQKQASEAGKSAREIALATDGLKDSQKKTIATAYDVIEAEEKRAEAVKKAAAEEAKLKATLLSVEQQLGAKINALDDLGMSQEEYNARAKLGLEIDEKLPDNIQAQIDKLDELRDAKQKAKDDKKSEDEEVTRRETVESEFIALSPVLDQASQLEGVKAQFDAERDLVNEYFQYKIEDAMENGEEYASLMEQQQAALTAIDADASQARQDILTAEQRAKLEITKDIFSGLSSLMDTESRKLFEIGKAAAISNSIITGIEAAVTNFKKGSDIGGIPLGAAWAAASAATTFAQIQQIKNTSFGSGSTSTSTTATAPAASETTAPSQDISVSLVGGDDAGRALVSILKVQHSQGNTIS